MPSYFDLEDRVKSLEFEGHSMILNSANGKVNHPQLCFIVADCASLWLTVLHCGSLCFTAAHTLLDDMKHLAVQVGAPAAFVDGILRQSLPLHEDNTGKPQPHSAPTSPSSNLSEMSS